MPAPRIGTSLSIAASAFDRPKSSAALAACGLVSFIWPSSAPTSSTGDVPPIFSWMYFQLHPFSRLMSRIFSVRSARIMDASLAFGLLIVGVTENSRLNPRLGGGLDLLPRPQREAWGEALQSLDVPSCPQMG